MQHNVLVDGQSSSWSGWRDDCDENPVSPQAGTWEYGRNGWCPGAIATGGLATLVLGTRNAQGYPAGAAVSYGYNPVVAYGGNVTNGTSIIVATAPSDQDIIVSDVILTPDTTDYICTASLQFRLELGSGSSVGTYAMQIKADLDRGYTNNSQNVVAQYASGIRIPAGDTLHATVNHSYEYNCSLTALSVAYAVSGYLAQP